MINSFTEYGLLFIDINLRNEEIVWTFLKKKGVKLL